MSATASGRSRVRWSRSPCWPSPRSASACGRCSRTTRTIGARGPAPCARSRTALDELEAEVQRAPSRVEVSIRDEQRSLDERVEGLEDSTSDAVEDVRQDLEELRQRVDELERQVERPTAPEQ